MNKTLVIVFVKEPKLGFVKTRLSQNMGEEFTLELYKYFVKDLVDTLKNSKYDFKLCAYPNLELVSKTFGEFDNFLQEDGDLGVKMENAFMSQFTNGYDKIVLIGSDTPHISEDLFTQSFLELDKNDIVLGPSLDGGYYLIAFNKDTFINDVFHDISWSTENVLSQTTQKLHKKWLYLLLELNDIDIYEDLDAFFDTFQNSYFKNSNTIKFLKKDLSWRDTM